MKIEPYLFFEGQCEEALAFYRTALGAEVTMVMRYKDNPEPSAASGDCRPPSDDMVMHAAFRIGDTQVMASDGMGSGKPHFQGITLSLDPATQADAQRLFTALSDGGQVRMPLGKTFYSPAFGMVVDRFGVSWMINVPQ